RRPAAAKRDGQLHEGRAAAARANHARGCAGEPPGRPFGRSDGGYDGTGSGHPGRGNGDPLMDAPRTSPSPAPDPAPNKWLVTAAISLGTLMGTIDISIVNVALPHVQASFGVAVPEAAWITTAYLVALVVILPLTGWLGATFGRKPVYQIGLTVFTGAS